MKKNSNQQLNAKHSNVRRRNRTITIFRSALLLGFLLVFNAFAWFIYISRVDTELDIRTLSWDVIFSEGSTAVRDVIISVDVYPGMEEYSHNISVTNASDVAADLSFNTKSVTLYGNELLSSDLTESQKVEILRSVLPLSVTYQFGRTTLNEETTTTFTVNVNWEYENNNYYKVPSVFQFDDELTYYSKSGNNYIEEPVTSATYGAVKDSLYLTKDDIDSYIGYHCSVYQKNTNKSCLVVKGELIAEQVNGN